VLELYCGLGGCAAALAGTGARVAAAYDVNPAALAVYRANFPHPAHARALDALPAAELARWDADLWWLSPPCQPYTHRGRRRDLDDPRAASLVALCDRIAELRPPRVALENVPGFAGSRAHDRLREVLDRGGWVVRERLLCPSELGLPNRRLRFYLVASRRGFGGVAADGWSGRVAADAGDPGPRRPSGPGRAVPSLPDRRPPLAALLDPEPDPALALPPVLFARWAGALDLVDAADPGAVTACFTAAYGRSPARNGSHLVTARGAGGRPAAARRFSPAEVARLLAFPAGYRLPAGLPRAAAWRLLGNSLSVAAVRTVLAQFLG
jgi:site-specific DNA-cytosine methylase